MKKLLGIIFLTFVFNTAASANDILRGCTAVIKILNSGYGYNFQNFPSDKDMIRNGDSVMCGYPPGSKQLIHMIINPARIHVTDPGYGNLNGHCIYPASSQIRRIRLSACRGW